MLTSGIPVTINSDDPAFFGPAYLNDNYEFIARVVALGPDQLAQLAKNSFSASFFDDAAKVAAHRQIEDVLAAWKSEQRQPKRPVLGKWFVFV
jgi:adenosine deaminase